MPRLTVDPRTEPTMHAIHRTLISALGLLALLLGGTLAAGPAQAHDEPTKVRFVTVQDGIPRSMDLYATLTDGREIRMPIGSTRTDVVSVRAKNERFRLAWYDRGHIPWRGSDDGVRVHFPPTGASLAIPHTKTGWVLVEVWRSAKPGPAKP